MIIDFSESLVHSRQKLFIGYMNYKCDFLPSGFPSVIVSFEGMKYLISIQSNLEIFSVMNSGFECSGFLKSVFLSS
jgi:hypothetical protein